LADDTLYWYVIWSRWIDDENYARMKAVFFAGQAAPVRAFAPYFARRGVVAQAKGQGVGRRSKEVVLREFDAHLSKIDALVAEQPFLTGDALTAADIAVGSQLMQLGLGLTPREGATLAAHTKTAAWLARTMERCG
jgi:glutathione S-transferase